MDKDKPENRLNHLHNLGFKKKLDVWVPHELTQKNMMDRISICESLLNRNKIDPFLKRIVTGDEKWVTYDNIERKRSWSKLGEAAQTVAKTGFYGQEGFAVCLVRLAINHLLRAAPL